MDNLEVGDKVTICKPDDINVFPDWLITMDNYNTKIAIITTNVGTVENERIFTLDIDGGVYNWNEKWLEKQKKYKLDIKKCKHIISYKDV